MVILSAILLTIYLGCIVYALLAPSRGPDPQRGQAIGCLWIVAICIAAVGGLLALSVATGWRWGVNILSTGIVYSGAIVLLGLVRAAWQKLKSR